MTVWKKRRSVHMAFERENHYKAGIGKYKYPLRISDRNSDPRCSRIFVSQRILTHDKLYGQATSAYYIGDRANQKTDSSSLTDPVDLCYKILRRR
jgi:hypothetical protein